MRIAARLQLQSLAVVAAVLIAILVLDERLEWRELVLPGAIGAIAALLLATLSGRGISQSIDNLRDVTRALASGDHTARPPLSAPGEIGELATAVHRLSEQLGSRMATSRAEDALVASLIEALDEGVVAVDGRRQVVRINAAARTILGALQPLPFSTDGLPRVGELQRALDGALNGRDTEGIEAVIGARTVSLTARPLAVGGAVLALFDLTGIRKLEMARRDFVANVSHELRTPLTVIVGFAETLAEDDPPADLRRQFANTIRTHTERMQRIVDDLLDLSRLESGSWEADVSPLEFREVAAEVAGTYTSTAIAKDLELEIQSPDGLLPISADHTALRQVLSNLVDNALRHTERGSVTIFAEPGTGGMWVGVRDTGRGIGRDHLPRIFERFYRVDSGRSRDSGGTGLGLAIVKHLVEAHGGTARAESEPGRGTTIAAFFPNRS